MVAKQDKILKLLIVPLTLLLAVFAFPGVSLAQQPNILLIVADDLGYSDLGSFGGEIRTPVLDQLAEEGVRFSNFHVLPTCSPTRAALLSGADNHVAGMGVMGEFIYPAIKDLPGYAGRLSEQVPAIPEILRKAGYKTYMAGKWHLGDEDDYSPFRRGFEQTFAMMHGGGSHWSDMKPLSPTQDMLYRVNGERMNRLPADFYSTKNYTDKIIEFISRDREEGKPFFAYLSYTAPHDPLHAPPEYIAKYQGIYDDGWEILAQKRLQGLKKLGIVPEDLTELPRNFLTSDWATQSEADKRNHARDMEVYAAMVDYMDSSIGRLFDYLKQNDLYENTIILFLSDNGANGAHATAYPGNADGDYLSSFDNSLENRGLPNSFVDMGPNWARAVSVPFRFFKSFTSEGGIRAPMIIKGIGDVPARGTWNHAFVHVTDIMPTLMEISGVKYPEVWRGKENREPIGKSIVPAINDNANVIRAGGMGYELFEMKAYILGDWKILRLPKPFGSGDWELFDLGSDPGETKDLSAMNPEIRSELISLWDKYATENEVFDHKGFFDRLYQKAYGTNAQ